MIVTLCTGSVPGRKSSTSVWPASWYAIVRFSASEMIIERRSTPIRTLSLAFSKSTISTSFLFWRAASSAASLTRLARSAPEKPGVPRARTFRSTFGASGMRRAWTRRISSRPLTSGRGTTTCRSKRPGRSDEKHALRDLAAELLELLRILQEIDDLPQLFLCFIDTGHVLKRHLVLFLGDQPCSRLPEAQRLRAAPLHLAHEEDPDADEEEHRHPLEEDRVPRVRVGRLHRDADAPVLQRLDQVGVLHDVGPQRLRRVLERVRDVVAADHDRVHATLVHGLQELGEVGLLLATLLRALEDGEQQNDDETDHHPEREIFVHLIHPPPL